MSQALKLYLQLSPNSFNITHRVLAASLARMMCVYHQFNTMILARKVIPAQAIYCMKMMIKATRVTLTVYLLSPDILWKAAQSQQPRNESLNSTSARGTVPELRPRKTPCLPGFTSRLLRQMVSRVCKSRRVSFSMLRQDRLVGFYVEILSGLFKSNTAQNAKLK